MFKFTTTDVGCWIDGANGQEHGRTVLAGMIQDCHGRYPGDPDGSGAIPQSEIRSVQEALAGPMSDDDWESELATDTLQVFTAIGLVWLWEAGDLILTPEDQLDA